MGEINTQEMRSYAKKISDAGALLRDEYEKRLVKDEFKSFSTAVEDALSSKASAHKENLDNYIASIGRNVGRLEALAKALEDYANTVDELAHKYKEEITEVNLEGVPTFATVYSGSGNRVNYTKYNSYKYMDRITLFSSDYSDANEYMQTNEFINKRNIYGLTEINNYKLYLQSFTNSDVYADKLLYDTLGSILQSLPNTGTNTKTWEIGGVYDAFEDKLGIDDGKSFLTQILGVLMAGCESDLTFMALKLEQYMEPWGIYGGDPLYTNFEFFFELIYNSYELMEAYKKVLKKGGDVTKFLQGIADSVAWLFNDYTKQIEYIDSIKESLTAAGFPAFQLNKCMDRLRTEYDTKVAKVINEALDKCADELVDKAMDLAVEGGTKVIPVIGNVDLGLDAIAGTAKIFLKDEAAALETLNGTQMCTNVMVDSYEYYLGLMKAGLATEEDMENADKLFRVICQAKISEYEPLQTIVGEKSPDYEMYGKKIMELKLMASKE